LWIAAAAGACTLAIELGAVRLIAPWFGASAGVWTNVIGVILLGLALGYLAGARLAAKPRPARALALVMLGSAAFTAWLPALARPVCGLFLPQGLSLQAAAGLWLWGSLASTLLLFLAPSALLGCVGPLAVELVQVRQGSHAGSAGGQVLCVSTLGSLAGTFATTHFLLPEVGITWTLLGASAVLAALGAALWIDTRKRDAGAAPERSWTASAAVLVLLTALPGSRLSPPDLPEGCVLLESAESAYQVLRVVEDHRAEPPLVLLQVNEGLDSFQSVAGPEPGLLGQGFYYDHFALPAWWSGARGRWKVLVLGLGAGTAFRVLEGASPPGVQLELAGVELDSRAVDLGRRWFHLRESDHARVFSGQDARAALRSLPGDFDLAILDAYAHQVEIPAHLSTREFFAELAAHLVPGGWVAVNVGGFAADDPVVASVGRTLLEAFPSGVAAARVPRARNFVLFARRGAALPQVGGRGWSFEGAVGAALLPPLELPGAWSTLTLDAPGQGRILTDDRNPLDELQRSSLEQGRARLLGGK